MVNFDEIVDAFKANLLEKLVKKHGPQPFESCWPELVENEYDQKVALVTQLIKAGVDCDWLNYAHKSPMELALALNQPKLVVAMLEAEATLFNIQQMAYRLVRRNNVRLLRMFFEIQQVSETDMYRMVSLAQEEAFFRRISMKKEMEDFCNKLMLKTFYSSYKIMKLSLAQRKQHIRKRIEIICKEVEFLQSYDTDSFTNIDNNFLASLGIVAENLYVIDHLWKHPFLTKLKQFSVWSSLQPHKINYLIVIFCDVLNDKLPDHGLVIDKNLLLDMLNMLNRELKVIYTKDYAGAEKMESYLAKLVSQNNVSEEWKSKYPQIKLSKRHRRFAREHDTEALTKSGFNTKQQKHLIALVHDKKNLEQLRELWLQEYPNVRLGQRAVARAEKGVAGFFCSFSRRTRYVLKTVNKIYSRVRNYYSLSSMLNHIHLIYKIPLTEEIAKEFGYAAFQRIVQIMGEFSKNTKQTPNLQGALHRQMSLWSSQSLLGVFQHRRNVVTHGLSLTEVNFRILLNNGELGTDILLNYCKMVQSELQTTYPHLKYYWLSELTRLIKGCLGRIRQLKTLKQRNSFVAMMAKFKTWNWDAAEAGLYDFDEINSVLGKLIKSGNDQHLHESYKEIQKNIKQAEIEQARSIAAKQRNLLMAFKFIESCGNYVDNNVLDRTLKVCLNISREYYSNGSEVSLVLEAIRLINDIIEVRQYSGATGENLMLLNRLLANKVDRKSQLRQAHEINQFVPFQNEQYTEQLLESLGVRGLSYEKFYVVHDALDSRVYDPLNKQHEVGMFAVEQKFSVIRRILQENDIKFDAQMLDKSQKNDSCMIQNLLEQMLESLYQLSRKEGDSEDQYFGARVLATQYGLLEVCAILSHTVPFRSNFDYFNTPMPLLAGKYLRNGLAHECILRKSAFFFGEAAMKLTIEVLYELRASLLNGQSKSSALPHFGEITEKSRRRKKLSEAQNISTKGKLDKILNSRLDIYGHYFFVWKGDDNTCLHNLLDVLLYYYPDEAIAYIEECSQPDAQRNRKSSTASIFSYLWNRLRYSDLLGYPLQPITKLFSLGGNSGIVRQDGDKKWQQLAKDLGVQWQDFGYGPPEQVEKILCYFLLVGRFDKFVEFFHRYGAKFDFIKFHKLLSGFPDMVDKLADFLPWGSVKDQGFSMLHSLCAENNVEALKSAIKRLSSKQLCILSKDGLKGFTPIQIATWNSSFGAIRTLLESKKLTQLDTFTLARVIETHQNDLLKYFIPLLETDLLQSSLSMCSLRIAATANIEAYKFLNEKLSAKAFQRLCCVDGNFELIHYAIDCGTKQSFLHQMITYPKYKPTFTNHALEATIGPGKFKNTDFLISIGTTVDYKVIETTVRSNCFKRLKWLLRKSEILLTDSQQQELCKTIVSEGRDLRMLKYFTGLESLPDDDLAVMLNLMFQRQLFDSCRFLCETFPAILENCNKPFKMHPIEATIDGILRNNSLTRDRPFLNFLIEKCTSKSNQETLIFDALKLGDLQIVQALIDAGVPTDLGLAGFTPLSLAAHNCATYPSAQAYAIFELLLKKGISDLQDLVFCKTHFLRTVRLLELLIEHTTFGATSTELLIVLLQVQAIGSERVMQALLRKYKFLAATVSFNRNERMVVDPRFKLVLSQHELDCMMDRFINPPQTEIFETTITQNFELPQFDYTKLF